MTRLTIQYSNSRISIVPGLTYLRIRGGGQQSSIGPFRGWQALVRWIPWSHSRVAAPEITAGLVCAMPELIASSSAAI